MANGFDKIISGVQSGIGFAQNQQRIGLQRQELEAQKERQRTLNQQVKIATADKAMSVIEKASRFPPKTGRAFLKSAMEPLKQAGVTLDPALMDSLWDPAMAETYGKAFIGLRRGLRSGNLDLSSTLSDEVLQNLGPQKAIEMLVGAADDFSKLERAAATQQGKIALEGIRQQARAELQSEKIESTEKIAGQRLTFERAKERRQTVGKLRDDVRKIAKDFSPQLQAVDKILGFNQKDLENPQNRIALVRLAQQLSEARNSVVRGEEFAQVAKAVPALDRAKLFVERFTTGQQVSLKAANDIRRMARALKPIQLKTLKKELSPFAQTVQQRGLGREAKQIFGNNFGLFRSQFRGGAKKQARRKGRRTTRATQTKMSPKMQSIVNRAEARLGRKLTAPEVRKLQSKFGG